MTLQNFLENNITLFIAIYLVGGVAWVLCSNLSSIRIRRGLRASIVFLAFPIFYLGHPVLFYQFWMFLLVSIKELDFEKIAILLAIWGIFVVISQIKIPKQ